VLVASGDNVVTVVDCEEFTRLPNDVTLAVSSDGNTGSLPNSRNQDFRASFARLMRRAILRSPTALASDPRVVSADGEWIRAFARVSRESGDLWIAELLLAADEQGVTIRTVSLPATDSQLKDSAQLQTGLWRFVIGCIRLALHKDDFFVESGGVRP
jgi:hypothetical protein